MTDFTQLTKQINDASENIKSRISGLESNFELMDNALKDVQVKGARPQFGINETKSDPAFSAYLTKGTAPMETKDLSVTNDGQGVTVRSDWSTSVASLVREYSPMRKLAGAISTNSNEVEILVNRGEPQSAWIGELDSRAETTTEFMTRHKIAVYENYAYPSITLQMIEDSELNIEDWLNQQVAMKFNRQEAEAFMNGDGTGKPRGLLNYGTVKEADFVWGADTALYSIGAQYSGVDADINDADALFDLVDSVKADYLNGSSWMMTRAFRNKVRKLKDTQGQYLLQPSLDLKVQDTLLGYPVYLSEDMPTLAADSVGALFGNFDQGYKIVDRLGLTVQRDATSKIGWIRYYVRRRLGGALVNPESIKALVLGIEPA